MIEAVEEEEAETDAIVAGVEVQARDATQEVDEEIINPALHEDG